MFGNLFVYRVFQQVSDLIFTVPTSAYLCLGCREIKFAELAPQLNPTKVRDLLGHLLLSFAMVAVGLNDTCPL